MLNAHSCNDEWTDKVIGRVGFAPTKNIVTNCYWRVTRMVLMNPASITRLVSPDLKVFSDLKENK